MSGCGQSVRQQPNRERSALLFPEQAYRVVATIPTHCLVCGHILPLVRGTVRFYCDKACRSKRVRKVS